MLFETVSGERHEAILMLLGPGKIYSGPRKVREKSWNFTDQNEWEPGLQDEPSG